MYDMASYTIVFMKYNYMLSAHSPRVMVTLYQFYTLGKTVVYVAVFLKRI